MIIEINPLDTLFFRDGKPFNMGEEVWADGIFPPPPSVIYGALRTAYFAENIEEFENLKREKKLNVKGEDITKDLEIQTIAYRIDLSTDKKKYADTIDCLPLPLDIVERKEKSVRQKHNEKNNKVYDVVNLELKSKEDNFYSSSENEYFLSYSEKVEPFEDGLLKLDLFRSYLNGELSALKARKFNDYIQTEPKIGIGRKNSTHSTDQSKIYRVGLRRLGKLSLIVGFNNLDIDSEKNGIFKLGGEGKAVSYKVAEKLKIKQPEINNKRFKVYLATPAIFENGWLPKWIDSSTLKGKVKYEGKEIEVKLLTASVGKPISIGGFDMKARKPKEMRKAVAPGSVYYFEINEPDDNLEKVRKVTKLFHENSITDYNSDKKQGFGISYVGRLEN